MANPIIQFTPDQFRELMRVLIPHGDPGGDPPPQWIDLTDREMLRRFVDLDVQFRIKELQIKQEKLEQMRQIIG